jgi:phosphoribosylaminoimidazole-succinocarboxamide synthase
MVEDLIKLPIVKAHYKGKVRDVLDLGENLIIITSDRVSAFDVVFPNELAGKGCILNQLSAFFFKKTKHITPNHFITDDINEMPAELKPFHDYLKGRCMLVKKTRVIPFECICRGYISGSAWTEYKNSGTIGGLMITDTLKQSQKFKETMFTPSTKAAEGHDENISYKKMCERMDISIAEKLKNISIELFNYAHDFFLERDIILADTKFEFGTCNGEVFLIDELFTPDSSRFWVKDEYEIGTAPKSYDKQFIRDYVTDIGWDKQPPAPELPEDIVVKTMDKYKQLYELAVR